jgi:hypothetical protein
MSHGAVLVAFSIALIGFTGWIFTRAPISRRDQLASESALGSALMAGALLVWFSVFLVVGLQGGGAFYGTVEGGRYFLRYNPSSSVTEIGRHRWIISLAFESIVVGLTALVIAVYTHFLPHNEPKCHHPRISRICGSVQHCGRNDCIPPVQVVVCRLTTG